MRVLKGLRGSFLCPKASFGSSRIGLFEDIWSDLCFIGDGVEVGRVSEVKRGGGGCLVEGDVPSKFSI